MEFRHLVILLAVDTDVLMPTIIMNKLPQSIFTLTHDVQRPQTKLSIILNQIFKIRFAIALPREKLEYIQYKAKLLFWPW